jgi:hypothetical protein
MNTAVIVEPREHLALPFVLNNVATCLPGWHIVIYHGTKNKGFLQDCINKDSVLEKCILKELPYANLTLSMYNELLTSPAFYESIPTDTFLIFQTDSMIFPQHVHLLNQFLAYDYVGAPLVYSLFHSLLENTGINVNMVGNGGFSLRKKSKMLEIIYKYPYANEVKLMPEDVYFSRYSRHVPPYEQAKQFSIESILVPDAFGCHKPWNAIKHDILFQTFPEIKTLYELQSVRPSRSMHALETHIPFKSFTSTRNLLIYASLIILGISVFAKNMMQSNWYYLLLCLYLICFILIVIDIRL